MTGHTRKWQAEHVNYRKLLDLLDAQTAIFADGGQPDYELMSDILYYMTQYPDQFHHPREDVAFARLLAYDPDAQPIVEALERQHEKIRQSSEALTADLGAASAGALMPRAAIVDSVRSYSTFLRGHLDKEEKEIFPRLATHLTDEDWFLVDSRIHFNDDPLFGQTVQTRFRSIHRVIADRAGCGCQEPEERVCCVE